MFSAREAGTQLEFVIAKRLRKKISYPSSQKN
jgi:hypothetical protein